MAVITGAYDRMESVLTRLGLASSAFTIVPGDETSVSNGTEAASALLGDASRLAMYDIVFVDCGAAVAEPSYFDGLTSPTIYANLRSFVEGGGRLYVTDESYDLIEQTWPSVIAFQSSTDGLSTTPEQPDAAEVGATADTVLATLHDDTLQAWLTQNGVTSAGGAMPVQGLVDGWAVVSSVDMTHAKVWASGYVSWYGASGFSIAGSGVRPLTVTFEAGCGRTLFTSYHTVEGMSPGAALSAQEQALAYLILEIGTCIQDPTLI